MPAPETGRAPFACRPDALRVGDLVRTPSRRWETVTAVEAGDAYSRSTRVVTDATGPDYPWVWINRHTVIVSRPASTTTVVPLSAARPRADRPAA